MSSRIRRLLRPLGAVAVVALAAGGAFAFQRRPVPAAVVSVESGDVTLIARGTGTLESSATVVASFTLPGRVAAITAREGDAVEAGQIVATLDTAQLDRERAIARAGVDLAAAGVQRALADVARATSQRDAARLDLDRTKGLVEAGALRPADLDASRDRFDRAEAELAAAQAARAQGNGSVSVARETVAMHAQRTDEGVLRSPVAGVVVRRHHEPGDVVGAGAPVLTIASTEKVWASVWVDETWLPRLAEGQRAEVELRGAGVPTLGARIDRIAKEVDRQTHEVLVDLALDALPGRLAFGQRVDARIELDARREVLRLPRQACAPDASRCLGAREGVLVELPVEPGLVGTEHVELRGGVSAGDVVVSWSGFAGPPPLGRRLAIGKAP